MTAIVTVVILLVAAGGGAYVYHAIARPVPALSGGGAFPRLDEEGGGQVAVVRAEAALSEVEALRGEVDRLRAEVRATAAEIDTGLTRLRQRRDAILADAESLAGRVRDELGKAETARRTVELAVETLRAPRLEASGPAPAGDGGESALAGIQGERAETLSELYQRLAKVEAALAALTAPILLPGEPYAVPDEFPPEALRWENWKEVGESAYALGEFFHLHRLHLAPATAATVTSCLTILRVALTQQIYPNLKPLPAPDDADLLRSGLSQIAAELAAVRDQLERDYQTLAGAAHPMERTSNG